MPQGHAPSKRQAQWMTLDIPTLLVMTVFVTALLGLLFLFSWSQDRNNTALAWWGAGNILGTLAIALISGASSFELPWGRIMAASVIVTVPLLVLVLVFQRRIVAGLMAGAVKG